MRLNGYSLARYEPDDELDGIWTREQLLEMGAPVRGLRFFTRVAVRPLAPDAPSGRTRRADRASAPAAIDLGSGGRIMLSLSSSSRACDRRPCEGTRSKSAVATVIAPRKGTPHKINETPPGQSLAG